MSSPTFGELGISDGETKSEIPLVDNIAQDFSIKDKDFKSLVDVSISDAETYSTTSAIPVATEAPETSDEVEVLTRVSGLTPDRSDLLEVKSSVLGGPASDILGASMTDEKLDEIKDQIPDGLPPSGSPGEIDQFDLSDPEESFFDEVDLAASTEKAEFSDFSSDPLPIDEPIESTQSIEEVVEVKLRQLSDETHSEAIKTPTKIEKDFISTADFLVDEITVISSSDEIPEGIPVAEEFLAETVDMPFDEPEDIPTAKRFFHEDDAEFHAGGSISHEQVEHYQSANVARPGELRSEIQSFVSPSERFSIDFAKGKFLRMEMSAEGMNGWNMTVVIILLTIMMIAVGTGPFFILILPFLLLFGIRLAIRIFATEKLYVEDQGIRHEVLLVPGFSLKWERVFTPNLTVLKTSDPFRFFRCRDKSSKRKDDMLFLLGDDWRQRIGFLTDAPEARWLSSHLHRFLRKVRTVH